MKRTATTLVLLAGFGGGCVSSDGPNAKKSNQMGGYGTVTRPMIIPGAQGPTGEPVAMTAARGAMPSGQTGTPATKAGASGVQLAGGAAKAGSGVVRAYLPSMSGDDSRVMPANGYGPHGPPGPPQGGILPVPGMGPPGAVAAVGAINPAMKPVVTNQRSSILFTGPAGMKITWQLPGGGFNDEAIGLTAPKDYNFLQGQVYRLRLSQILPNFPGRTFYPTLEVSPATPKSLTFLAHSSIPITFDDEDFRQAASGNLVVKVVYLPDPTFQDFATVGPADVIVSTRLDPSADPVAEAQKRGTILAIIRLGNIDLENRASPAMTAPPPGVFVPPGAVMPPVIALPSAGGPPPGAPVPPPGAMAVPGPGASAVPSFGPSPAVPTTAQPPIARPATSGAPGPLPPMLSGREDAARPVALPPIK